MAAARKTLDRFNGMNGKAWPTPLPCPARNRKPEIQPMQAYLFIGGNQGSLNVHVRFQI
jgi:hypothetical protein